MVDVQPIRFHEDVVRTIRKWKMLSAGARVGVAVSGGADSVALLTSLAELAVSERWILHVLHVNHKLRGEESDGDAVFVRDLAAQLGLFCQITELSLPGQANREQEARDLRRAWFQDRREHLGLERIALGHTKSDQVETVLFRILRGAGGAGLAGILPVTPDGYVRPLFNATREVTRDYLREQGQPWREDSSNQDFSFDRNRIRLTLLPQLAREWNPTIESTLASLGEWARAEEDYWSEIVLALAEQHLKTAPDGALLCEAERLLQLPQASARRLIRYAFEQVRGDLREIGWFHTEQALQLASQEEGSGRLQVPGVDVMRSFGWVRFAKPGSYGGERHAEIIIDVPGEASLPDSRYQLRLRVENQNSRYNDGVNSLDRGRISGPLTLRTWQPGDHYQPVGYTSPIKLKTLFQEAKVPLWERRAWPILAARNEIVWSRRFGVAGEFASGPSTQRSITVSEIFVSSPQSSLQNRNQESSAKRL